MSSALTGMAGVVLAGGKSRRMGRDKRFLEVGGRSMLDRVCAVMGPLFPECLLSVAEPNPHLEGLHCRIVTDVIPGCAALGGLYAALSASSHHRIFVVGCDMPFISSASIRRVVELSGDCDVVMLELATGLHPCTPSIRKTVFPSCGN